MPADPLSILKSVYGYDTFRGRQREIIEHVIAGNHAFVLMPTGGGKSLCYQIPALVRPGIGLVVSPLIALMEDQVAALRQAGVKAAALNSRLWGAEKDRPLARYRAGRAGPPLHGPGNAFEAREPRPAEVRAPLAHRHRRGPLRFAMGP